MRLIATGAFFAAMAIYVAARTFEPAFTWLAWLRAFCEAAMIGAAADWFAVVALFRHPLGIPIPHTAIIPKNKERIGRSLADLIQTNFLTHERVLAKLDSLGLVSRLAGWLSNEANSDRLSRRLAAALPGFVDALGDEQMARLLRDNIRELVTRIEVAPLAGNLAESLISEGRHQTLLTAALQAARKLVDDSIPTLHEKIEEEFPQILNQVAETLPVAGPILQQIRSQLAQAIAVKVASKAQSIIDNALENPNDAIRKSLEARAREIANDLKSAERVQRSVESLKFEALHSEGFERSIHAIWRAVKSALKRGTEGPAIQRRIHEFALQAGRALEADSVFRARVEEWLRDAVTNILETHGHEVHSLITETVQGWKEEEIADKLEPQVGADLQYIRLNGTIIGGAFGVVLHALGRIFWP